MKNMETARRENAPRPKETNNSTFNNHIISAEVITTAPTTIYYFDSCVLWTLFACLLTQMSFFFQNLKYKIL